MADAEASAGPFSEYSENAALEGLGARQLERKAYHDLLRRLAAAVDGQSAAATFVCGGSVPVSSCVATSIDNKTNLAGTPRIQLRWKTEGHVGGIVYFPMSPDDNDMDMYNLSRVASQLLSA